MSKTETVVWHLVAHQLVRKIDGWFGKKLFEVSSKWETRLEKGYKVETRWEHRRFNNINKAVEYYLSIESNK